MRVSVALEFILLETHSEEPLFSEPLFYTALEGVINYIISFPLLHLFIRPMNIFVMV